MGYMLKRELTIVVLFVIYILVLQNKTKVQVHSYIKVVFSMLPFVVFDILSEEFPLVDVENEQLLYFIILQWLVSCFMYILSINISYRIIVSREKRGTFHKKDLWKYMVVIAMIGLGAFLCIRDRQYVEVLMENRLELLRKGQASFMDDMFIDFTTDYYRILQFVRYMLISWTMGVMVSITPERKATIKMGDVN